jgi:peptidoglycan/xylan/chitin deacetylase (PgdA/CDA1 family)
MGLKDFAFALVNRAGMAALWRLARQGRRMTILCYHDPAPETMDVHLAWLSRHYNLVPLDAYVSWRKGALPGLPPRPLAITLDDGHAGNARLEKVFRHYGVAPTIFLCSDIVGTQRHFWWQGVDSEAGRQRLKRLPDAARLVALRESGFEETREYPERCALSREEIDAMRQTVDFQAHTRLHPVLPMCDERRAREEITGCRRVLAERFGLESQAFAYPNGDYCERDIRLVQEAGFQYALTIDAGLNDGKTDLFRLRRILVPDNANIDELAVKACGLWAYLTRLAGKRPGFGHHVQFDQ